VLRPTELLLPQHAERVEHAAAAAAERALFLPKLFIQRPSQLHPTFFDFNSDLDDSSPFGKYRATELLNFIYNIM
jgi:hypothetical protein